MEATLPHPGPVKARLTAVTDEGVTTYAELGLTIL